MLLEPLPSKNEQVADGFLQVFEKFRAKNKPRPDKRPGSARRDSAITSISLPRILVDLLRKVYSLLRKRASINARSTSNDPCLFPYRNSRRAIGEDSPHIYVRKNK